MGLRGTPTTWFFCARALLAGWYRRDSHRALMCKPTTVSHRARGQRLMLRFALVQLLAVVVASGMALMLAGLYAMLATLMGGGSIVIGNALFGLRLFAPGIAPVRVLARAVWSAEVLKWVWVVGSLWAALHSGLPSLPLIVGVVAAQVGFWVALGVVRVPPPP